MHSVEVDAGTRVPGKYWGKKSQLVTGKAASAHMELRKQFCDQVRPL